MARNVKPQQHFKQLFSSFERTPINYIFEKSSRVNKPQKFAKTARTAKNC